jgi:hypothetical protein
MKDNTKHAMTETKYVTTAVVSAVFSSSSELPQREKERYRKLKVQRKAAAPRMCDQILTDSLWMSKTLLRERR